MQDRVNDKIGSLDSHEFQGAPLAEESKLLERVQHEEPKGVAIIRVVSIRAPAGVVMMYGVYGKCMLNVGRVYK
jgi:hypothetical protein